MGTSAQARIAELFKNAPLPAPPPADVKTYAEQELEAQMASQSSWRIPNEPQYPRTHRGPTPKPADNSHVLTSSDEDDDYVKAFTSKPQMKPTKPQNSKQQSQGHVRVQSGADEHQKYEGVSRPSPPTSDKHGKSVTGHFCSFNLAAKFPYKYLDDPNGQVSRHFFANGKFFERTWDLYYLHGPESSFTRPLILLPYEQVRTLVDEIALTLKADVAVPAFPFTLTFFDDGTPQPQLLCTCRSRADINEMQDSIPPAAPGHGETPVDASETLQSSFLAYRLKCERAQAGAKRKNASSKKRKKAAGRSVIPRWCHSLKRAQQYFGLRPPYAEVAIPDESMTWDEQASFYEQQAKIADTDLEPLNISKPAPFLPAIEAILICIDVESYEREHRLITEVGISTLDTLDLIDVAPGPNGENWRKQIRSRHLRIKEHAHLRNTDFCIGDPEAFQFGESEFVSLDEVGEKIDSCFEWPFSVQYKHDGKLKIEQQRWDSLVEEANITSLNDEVASGHILGGDRDTGEAAIPAGADAVGKQTELPQKGVRDRNILIVGHDFGADQAYLERLNSAIFATATPTTWRHGVDQPDTEAVRGKKALESIREGLDTATLYKVLLEDKNPKGLAKILYNLDIRSFYLHNGGNDARYTLEALVAMTIKARQMDDGTVAESA
ncbi:uncharacterized protein HMPREF1541_00355 [Cyphellophora europaea CBS 101466]|uniref:Gfd2/YDR514C-like C-terminal domain-containing protein n=1 Tax=Cyphellophora europaea (strain CBS 101466) TaxID=1220924 RepID=W2SBR0_CYPE1|nr:uncharacterized protein HMPREF1541_00355 [Cyphellophora europaea CBS 101466]ETN46171.1 hypothetical protein HMPREF1541_00355 [Cyphellophora europaea CBS 101466]